MEWEHKEQDALEWMYTNQPWVRSHLAFIPQRKINSFPLGACGDKGFNPKIHYNSNDRDFLVNMAGCEWGRDCWGEMYEYRRLSERLNRNWLQKLRDSIVESISRKPDGDMGVVAENFNKEKEEDQSEQNEKENEKKNES